MHLGRWSGAVTAALVAVVVAGAAEAHTFGTAAAGFSAGLAHPLVGLDHLLAMVAVGLWAVQLAERTGRATALWLVPGAFVSMMAAGAAHAMISGSLPGVELGILGSLVVLGLLVAVAPYLPVWAGAAIAGVFALFHGHAHGGEVPEAAVPALYAAGFIITTAFLHAVGLGLGLLLSEGRVQLVSRLGGAGIAATGVALYIFGVMSSLLDRRSFLSGLALSLAAAPAAALTVDENAARERLYLSACETRTAHDQLIDELVTQLEGNAQDVSPEVRAQNIERVKAMSCPVCGCKLGAIQPYPTRF